MELMMFLLVPVVDQLLPVDQLQLVPQLKSERK
jgi:hypothetical protein